MFVCLGHQLKTQKKMNGLSNLVHVVKRIGDQKCDPSIPECGSTSNGMVVIRKTAQFGQGIRNWKKGEFKPCLKCLNKAYEQGRISANTYNLAIEIRK